MLPKVIQLLGDKARIGPGSLALVLRTKEYIKKCLKVG